MHIEIQTTETNTFSGISKGTGKPFTITTQVGYLHKNKQPYPEKMKLRLKENQAPYNPGVYALSEESYYIDRFGGISVEPQLVIQK